MSVLKTQKGILNNIPEITEDEEKEINKIFKPYFFFTDHRKEQVRECWCSSCREHFYYEFTQRTETPNHYEFIRAKHNGSIVCPKCGRTMTAKETYRARTCSKLGEWKRFVIIKKRSKNEVYLLCGYAQKSYYNDYLAKPRYEFSTIYYLTPGYVREFRHEYDYMFLGLKTAKWYEPTRITEPFTKTWWYNISSIDKRGYSFINFNDLGSTFLKYAPFDEFYKAYCRWYYCSNAGYYINYGVGESPDVKLLCYYALYPGIEILLKSGLEELVCSLVDNNPMKRYINWNGKNPREMFGMTKAQFKDMVEFCDGILEFKLYQELKRVSKKASFAFCRELSNAYKYDNALKLIKAVRKYNLNLTHTLNYLNKLTEELGNPLADGDAEYTVMLWTDYIDFASQLKYDFSRLDVVFPKKLQKAHDEAADSVVVLKDKPSFKAYQKRYEKLKKLYEYSDGQYQIVIPRGINDIVDEGKALSHCVGGYASRHVNGNTTILFLRKCSAPAHRLVTIEVDDKEKRVIQKHGYKNRSLNRDEQAFVDKWIAWVKAGSKRKKEKNKAVSAA